MKRGFDSIEKYIEFLTKYTEEHLDSYIINDKLLNRLKRILSQKHLIILQDYITNLKYMKDEYTSYELLTDKNGFIINELLNICQYESNLKNIKILLRNSINITNVKPVYNGNYVKGYKFILNNKHLYFVNNINEYDLIDVTMLNSIKGINTIESRKHLHIVNNDAKIIRNSDLIYK